MIAVEMKEGFEEKWKAKLAGLEKFEKAGRTLRERNVLKEDGEKFVTKPSD